MRPGRSYVSAGGNIAGPAGPPEDTLAAARTLLARRGVVVAARSRTYLSDPWGGVRQPAFVNEVWEVRAAFAPAALLAILLGVENMLGRRRRRRWGPRAIDLDLLACNRAILSEPGPPSLTLPHPWLARRAFVLAPLADIAPRWVPPGETASVSSLLAQLGVGARGRVRLAG